MDFSYNEGGELTSVQLKSLLAFCPKVGLLLVKGKYFEIKTSVDIIKKKTEVNENLIEKSIFFSVYFSFAK